MQAERVPLSDTCSAAQQLDQTASQIAAGRTGVLQPSTLVDWTGYSESDHYLYVAPWGDALTACSHGGTLRLKHVRPGWQELSGGLEALPVVVQGETTTPRVFEEYSRYSWCAAGTHLVLTDKAKKQASVRVQVFEGMRQVSLFWVPLQPKHSLSWLQASAHAASICIFSYDHDEDEYLDPDLQSAIEVQFFSTSGMLTASFSLVSASLCELTSDHCYLLVLAKASTQLQMFCPSQSACVARVDLGLSPVDFECETSMMGVSVDGRTAAVWSQNRILTIVSPSSQSAVASAAFIGEECTECALCPSGSGQSWSWDNLAVGVHSVALVPHAGACLSILDARPGAVGTVLYQGEGNSPVCDPSGRLFAVSVGAGEGVRVLDGSSGTMLASHVPPLHQHAQKMPGRTVFLQQLTWMPDGLGLCYKAPSEVSGVVHCLYVSLRFG